MSLGGPDPLIVTAALDAASFAALDALRRRHFPAKLNRVPAHVSLFHHLPGEERDTVLATLREACGAMAPFALEPNEWRSLGRGVALAYEAPELAALHGRLAGRFAGWLTAQDRQGFRAHVTIQNKVAPAVARATLERLRDGAEPPRPTVEGLALWHYRGGPWQPAATVRFGRAT